MGEGEGEGMWVRERERERVRECGMWEARKRGRWRGRGLNAEAKGEGGEDQGNVKSTDVLYSCNITDWKKVVVTLLYKIYVTWCSKPATFCV